MQCLPILFQLRYFSLSDFDPMRGEEQFLTSLLIMGAIFMAVALILITVLLVIFFVVLFLLFVGGTISTSVIVGFHQKSVQSGFKALFITGATILTLILSIIFFVIINSIKDYTSNFTAVFFAVIVGGLSGWLFGELFFLVFKKVFQYFKSRFVG